MPARPPGTGICAPPPQHLRQTGPEGGPRTLAGLLNALVDRSKRKHLLLEKLVPQITFFKQKSFTEAKCIQTDKSELLFGVRVRVQEHPTPRRAWSPGACRLHCARESPGPGAQADLSGHRVLPGLGVTAHKQRGRRVGAVRSCGWEGRTSPPKPSAWVVCPAEAPRAPAQSGLCYRSGRHAQNLFPNLHCLRRGFQAAGRDTPGPARRPKRSQEQWTHSTPARRPVGGGNHPNLTPARGSGDTATCSAQRAPRSGAGQSGEATDVTAHSAPRPGRLSTPGLAA